MQIESNNANIEITSEALDLLMAYHWPGNIRELRNVLRVAIAFSDQHKVTKTDLPDEFILKLKTSHYASAQSTEYMQNHTLSQKHIKFHTKIGKLVLSLRKNKWNITDTAHELNISRATIYRKMKKYNIVPPNNMEL